MTPLGPGMPGIPASPCIPCKKSRGVNQWAFLTPQRNVSGNDSNRGETERKEGRSSAAAGGVPTQSSDRAGQPGNLKPRKKSRQLSVTRPPLANLTTMVELDLRPLTPFTPTVSFCMRRFSFFHSQNCAFPRLPRWFVALTS